MVRNAQRLVALEPGAEALGLHPGQTLTDARALVPGLETLAREPGADAALLGAVADWCDRYTPLVAMQGGDGLVLDITGCAHLFRGEAALAADIRARLTGQGLHLRLGLADTPGGASALARFAAAPIARAEPGPDALKAALSPLPLSALRIDEGTATGLRRVGLKTVGCIADLPRAPLARRYGAELLRQLDRALGREEEAISPRRPVIDLTAEKRFFDPITHESDIARVIALLAEALVPMLEARGLGARALELCLFRVDGVVERLDVAAASPLRSAPRIAALFKERIAGLRHEIDAGFGFDLVRLGVRAADPFGGAQGDMITARAPEDSYQALVDRLGARLGPDRVRVFAGADTHIPERAFATLPVTRARKDAPPNSPAGATPAPPLTRPLWLLTRPEPVEAVAEVPDGPPLRFRWRKAAYEITRAEGPERIACEWWRDGRGSQTRDYYRIEAREGHRFWMFRQGLYGRETTRPRWYLHGVFP